MKIRQLSTIVLACGLVTACVSGCNRESGPPDPKLKAAIIGKWEEIDGGRTVEFTDQGKLRLSSKELVSGYTYEWIGPSQIEWKDKSVEGGGWPGGRATVAVEGDMLTMDITLKEAQSTAKFKRTK